MKERDRRNKISVARGLEKEENDGESKKKKENRLGKHLINPTSPFSVLVQLKRLHSLSAK